MDIIEEYLKTRLAPRLKSYRLNKEERAEICADVGQRLTALLKHWQDLPFRRALLTLALEEALFWEPRAIDVEIRALVYLAVRCSLIEDLNFAQGSMRQRLTDEAMPALTAEAIEFFGAVDFSSVTLPADLSQSDLFGTLPQRFPHAWQSLSVLAAAPFDEARYVLTPAQVEPLALNSSRDAVRGRSVTVNGMSAALDPLLVTLLLAIKCGESPLFVADSFKRISRNCAKLLSILDHTLRYGATFVSANYLLSDSYVARRSPLLRPGHNEAETTHNFTNPMGLNPRHRAALFGG